MRDWLWQWCVAALLIWAGAGSAQACRAPSLRSLPPLLLDAPVNLTWAANHPEHWNELGVRGFVVRGLFDALQEVAEPSAEGESEPTAEDEATKEIRLANARLGEAGIDRNFLCVTIAPDDTYFSVRSTFQRGVASFQRAGAFCDAAGLHGVAVDTQSAAFLYDYRWDGYDLDETPAEELAERARDFGRRSLRAFIAECPHTEILIRCGRLSDAGPLWFALFEGMVESIGAAETIPVYLLAEEALHTTEPERLVEQQARLARRMGQRLRPQARNLWRRYSGVALGLEPLSYENGRPVAHVTPEHYRVQLAAAKVLSRGYVWVWAPRGGWWHITQEEAGAYEHTAQRGAATVRPTPPVHSKLSAYTLRGVPDALEPLAPAAQGPGYVLRSEAGAVVLAWPEAGAHLFAEGLVLEPRTQPLHVTRVASGERRMVTPREERIALAPTQEVVVLDGVPVREWAAPAGLWMQLDEPLSAAETEGRMCFGWYNSTETRVQAQLEAWTSSRYSIGAASFPLNLAPREAAEYSRTVKGVFAAGEEAAFTLGLVFPGGGTVTRSFSFPVLPALSWATTRDGAFRGGPVLLDADQDGALEAVVCSEAGDVACYTVDGALRWEHRFRARFVTSPVVHHSARLVAVVDHRGTLRVISADGATVTATRLDAQPMAGLATAVFVGNEQPAVVVALDDGRVVRAPGPGLAQWAYATDSERVFLAAGDGAPAGWVYVTTGPAGKARGMVHALDATGAPQWMHELAGAASCPAYVTPDGDVLTGTDSGAVQQWDAAAGTAVAQIDTSGGGPVRAIIGADIASEPGREILIGDAGGVACVTAAFESLWERPLPGTRGLATAMLEGEPCVFVGTDAAGVWCLSGDGAVQWQDPRATGAIAGAPVAGDLDGDRQVEALYTSDDRHLRALSLGPSWRRRPPTVAVPPANVP